MRIILVVSLAFCHVVLLSMLFLPICPLIVAGSKVSSEKNWTIGISVTVEVKCRFEIHNGRCGVNLTGLDDQLKRFITATIIEVDLPSILRWGNKTDVRLSIQVTGVATAKFQLPIFLNFKIPDTAGGYHSFSISKSAQIQIPNDGKDVSLLFQLDETNCVNKLEMRYPAGTVLPKDETITHMPFIVKTEEEIRTPGADRIDVLVASSIWSGVQASVTQYSSDLSPFYSVYVYSVTYGTPEQVRSFLQGHLSLALKGALLVGNIPYALYYIPPHDVWDLDPFPCDLFYMDLNGVWTDSNGDGKYEDHTGDVAPEIWVGRIKPTGMGDETAIINNYFTKNHAYRTGTISALKRALVYVDDDWDYMADGVDTNMKKVYGTTTKVYDRTTTTATDYKNRLGDGYEWVHLQCHGWPGGHVFMIPGGDGGTVYSSDYTSLDPRVLFYQFFVCSGARFSTNNYLAGVSVFKTSYGLLAIGSTKTGSMLYFEDFYTLVSTSKDIGTAFKSWFISYGELSRDWFYGLAIIGDPSLAPSTMLDFFVSASSGITVQQGKSASNTITVYRTGLSSLTVTLTAPDLPSGVTASFAPDSGSPTYTSTCTISTSLSTSLGSHMITVIGTGGGLKRTTTFTLTVEVGTVQVTVMSDPTGTGFVTVDGTAITTPQTFTWTIESTHTLTANSPVSGGVGNQYVWVSWSDGGAQSHTIMVPSSPTTYTANFKKQYMLTVAVTPTGCGTLSVSSGWQDSGTTVLVTATPNTGCSFYYWSLDGVNVGSSLSYSVLMNSPHSLTAFFRGTSTMSLGLSAESIALNASVTLSGTITPAQPSPEIPVGITVVLSYSLDGSTWNVFIMTQTASGGAYSVVWYPPYPKTYQIRATWSGNANYEGSTSSSVSLTVTGTLPSRITLLVSGPTSTPRGSVATFEVLVTNPGPPMSTTLYFEVIGTGGYWYFDAQQISVDAGGTGRFQFAWHVPSTASAGQYQVLVGLIPPKTTSMSQTQITVA